MTPKLTRVVAAAGICAVAVAGCSSTKPAPETAPTTHGGLAECLTNHGVQDAGGPAAVLGPPAGVDRSVWDAAMQACSSLAPGPAAP